MVLTLVIIMSMLYVSTKFVMLKVWSRQDDVTDWEFIKQAAGYLKPYWRAIVTRWHFGTSFVTEGQPTVLEHVAPRIPYTLAINFVAFGIYLPLAVLLGTLSALYKGSFFDKLTNLFTTTFSSIPIYISMDLLYFVVGYKWGWFPYAFPDRDLTLWLIVQGYVIPTIALSSLPLARITRAVRAELVDSFEENYILLARTKGFTHNQAVLRHSFRNIIVPVMPQVFNVFYIVLNASFLVELVYRVPGIASLLYDSMIEAGDMLTYITIDVGTVVFVGGFYASICLVVGLGLDMVNGLIDPRIRYTK